MSPATMRGELASALLAFRRPFLAVGMFSCAINVLLLVPAIYMLQIYDRVLSSRNEVTLYMLTLIMVGLYVIEAALELVRSRVLIRTSVALDLKLNARVFDASFERYLRRRGGNPGQALADLSNVRQFLTSNGLFAFFDTPWTPIYIAVIFLLHPWLGVFAVVAALLLVCLAAINERATGPLLGEAGRSAVTANNYAASNLRNVEVIEAMGMLQNLRQRWFGYQSRTLELQSTASDRAATVGALTRFWRLSLQSGILGLGALLVLDNDLTPGAMIAASILLGRALAPVELAISTWRAVTSARGAYERLDALLEAHPARGASITLPRPLGAVQATDLVVGAPGRDTPILTGVSFGVPAGSCVAVIGPSAAGKSSLARALVGVWAPRSGTIRLDGAELHTWNKAELGPWIGYLPQDVELFEGTIAENIARFGELDDVRVVAAAQCAGVHEMVLGLPMGYDTQIGEAGTTLSGGQRQRVALARALYGEPSLVVLDEPNANLDDAGDAALMKALQSLKAAGCTVFVISHRVNILRAVDAVLILVNGSVQAFGPRDEVLKSLPRKAQAGGTAGDGAPATGRDSA